MQIVTPMVVTSNHAASGPTPIDASHPVTVVPPIPNRTRQLPRVGSRAVDEVVGQRRAQGLEVLPLTAYPGKELPEDIRIEAAQVLGKVSHPPARGLLELRVGISEYLARELNTAFNPEREVLIANGAMHALQISLQTILEPGDEVLLFSPCFFFEGLITLAGGVPVLVPLDEKRSYQFEAARMAACVTKRTRAILLNTPANPTGYAATLTDLERIAAIAAEHQLFMISDESYDRLVYDGRRHVSLLAVKAARARSIMIRSFTKSFSLSDWRVGYLVAPPWLCEHLLKILEWNVLFCGYFAQKVASLVICKPLHWLADVPRQFQENRNVLFDALSRIEGLSMVKPLGNPFLFVNMANLGISDVEFSRILLAKHGVPSTPGSWHHEAGHVRLAFGGSREVIRATAERFRAAVKGLHR